MSPITDKFLFEQVARFSFDGTVVGAVPYGNGHINDTFAVYTQLDTGNPRRYILQRVNGNVFKKPQEVMENVCGVTKYLSAAISKAGGDPMRETLNIITTVDGKSFETDANGDCWRAYVFIEDTISYQMAESTDVFYNSARAFGKFAMLLADYPADTLHDTIPHFHDTPDRFRQFKEAVAADVCHRVASAQKEIDFVLEREQFTHLLVDLLAQGRLPLRVTHNDTKLNNVLIDRDTGTGICIIDLDTVMPGLSLYDFGDSIRFGASTAAEDEQDLSKVRFDIDLFDCYARGYLEEAGSVMTSCELDNLPEGSKMMTFECGMRFLTDYLSGDTYFKIHRDGHNLDRARTQFKLVADMEDQWDAMHSVVKKYAAAKV